ncbi:DedA family protein [Wenxinia marina]|uniref:Putative membrane-associated protein n=1 Tax=Wenxinia marina DSM 24838 TaxID=1123501 RepID=A0A0D0QFA4_9RHOB|nr:DedA family protein [Wenxinia marina]KIQ71002.1 putative membrane-associated protein [Wenxinia marina DSM 24838]GGL55643.1 membrane protein [Wenxinia marina]
MFDWMTGLIDSMGAFGVGLLMFIENVFPPIPSELVMPLAGFNAARGDMSLVLVIIAGSIGSLAGAYLWYWIGQKIGRDRLMRFAEKHGRWTAITPEDIETAQDWFDRRGGAAVFIGRLIPTVRTLISVPAGMAEMPLGKFLAYSAVGTALWTTLLALLGYWLESGYEAVSSWLDPISWAVVIGIIGIYLWRVATYDRRKQGQQAESSR